MSNQIINGALNYLGNGLILIKNYSYAYTISGSASLQLTANDFVVTTPTGYAPFAIAHYASGNSVVVPVVASAINTGTSTTLNLLNTTTSSKSGTARIHIVYIKEGLLTTA